MFKWFHFKPFHPNISRAALVAAVTTVSAQQTLLQQILSAKAAACVALGCVLVAALSQPAVNFSNQQGPPQPGPEASGHA